MNKLRESIPSNLKDTIVRRLPFLRRDSILDRLNDRSDRIYRAINPDLQKLVRTFASIHQEHSDWNSIVILFLQVLQFDQSAI